jgi:hypothetical protein
MNKRKSKPIKPMATLIYDLLPADVGVVNNPTSGTGFKDEGGRY